MTTALEIGLEQLIHCLRHHAGNLSPPDIEVLSRILPDAADNLERLAGLKSTSRIAELEGALRNLVEAASVFADRTMIPVEVERGGAVMAGSESRISFPRFNTALEKARTAASGEK